MWRAYKKHWQRSLLSRYRVQQWLDDDDRLEEGELRNRIGAQLQQAYIDRYAHVGDQMREVERQIMLQVLDNLWKEHLARYGPTASRYWPSSLRAKKSQARVQA